MMKRRNYMKRKQPAKKAGTVGKTQEPDRSFIVAAEAAPDQWREILDLFFAENDTGLDHVRRMMDMSKTDVDRYYFTGGYEISNSLPQRPDAGRQPKPNVSAPVATSLRSFSMTYGSNGCFRYALP